ncbi:six-hairpin glycosidase [Zunongwangia sp. HGR-M22]|uniref:six-hairpin glycosidase n=1 Tax=Zunongwangia sp. HGR-M22 TaxID=3015168 RepID=UPI0022DDA1C4|nr:six-hairpin glycosidase [Zunongwangia sp. HGR-M22]WBL24659.1 six-hairpin glycosidase [Zunongwangia sp. HGR-M22]
MRLNSKNLRQFTVTVFCAIFVVSVKAQQVDTIKYTGNTLSNIDYHHGQLKPVIGTHAVQIMRASREHPETADDFGWTYNHAPNMAYWNDTFFVQYLSNPVGEHIPPGQSFLITSKDGQNWEKPKTLFPVYSIPDGYKKEGHPAVANDLTSVMHQRMGFYNSLNGKFLALGYYGISMDQHDSPNDGKGIGRVVREIYKDGSFGTIYFIRYNKSWDKSLSEFKFYKKSKDKQFIAACEELLSKPLMMQQWVEEQDRDDPLIPLQEQFKAFSYYHLPDDRLVGLWKHALTSMSLDGGETWEYHPLRAPGFVNKNAKIWGQKTSDEKYATVYNPSEFRWPLAVSTSKDGIVYDDLLLIHGEISTMRYGGNYKSYGPQYVRGILEGNGTPPDGKMWITYSVNKEDIWVASVPVPITATAQTHANEIFDQLPDGKELEKWNYYDLQWASAKIEEKGGKKWLALKDKDAYDYSRAERIIPATKNLWASFTIRTAQNDHGILQIEFQDEKGQPAVRIVFDENGEIKAKAGYRFSKLTDYQDGKDYEIEVRLEPDTRSYMVKINGGDEKRLIFYAPVNKFERIMFRTGEQRYEPTPDSPAANHEDLENPGKEIPETKFYINGLKTEEFQK